MHGDAGSSSLSGKCVGPPGLDGRGPVEARRKRSEQRARIGLEGRNQTKQPASHLDGQAPWQEEQLRNEFRTRAIHPSLAGRPRSLRAEGRRVARRLSQAMPCRRPRDLPERWCFTNSTPISRDGPIVAERCSRATRVIEYGRTSRVRPQRPGSVARCSPLRKATRANSASGSGRVKGRNIR